MQLIFQCIQNTIKLHRIYLPMCHKNYYWVEWVENKYSYTQISRCSYILCIYYGISFFFIHFIFCWAFFFILLLLLGLWKSNWNELDAEYFIRIFNNRQMNSNKKKSCCWDDICNLNDSWMQTIWNKKNI